LSISIDKLKKEDINFYENYQSRIFKQKRRLTIGNVVRIANNLSHDYDLSNQFGIVISYTGIDFYYYVIVYSKRADRYCVCGFQEDELIPTSLDILFDLKLYNEFEDYIIKNHFRICTNEFEQEYRLTFGETIDYNNKVLDYLREIDSMTNSIKSYELRISELSEKIGDKKEQIQELLKTIK
jgi:hypothetical protein